MQFEWDAVKAATNLRKHAVAFTEAASVFGDPFSDTFPDPDHSVGEVRFVTVGRSLSGRLLVVGHTDRGESIRIITARHATPYERRYYEDTHR
jgi:uncharacterized DUF497 family protein